jgi:peptide/nickel transport system permease protein
LLAYLTKRLAYYVALLVVATFLSYLLASLGLSPRSYFDARNPRPPAAAVDQQLHEIGLDDHQFVLERFGGWAEHAITGDFGKTIDDTSVNAEFGRRVGVSLRLLLAGTIIGTAIGILVGVWGAVRQYRFSDRAITTLSFVILSMPTFLIAILLKIGALKINAAVGSNVIKYTGEKTPNLTGGVGAHLGDRLSHLLLPTLSIALITIATYSRYQRSTMLDVLGSDYLRTAQAKGLRRRTVLIKHGLRTALIPISTFFAYGFLGLFTGAIFTEIIYNWHGMGSWFIDSIGKNDVNSVQAVNVFAAFLVLLSGFLSDVLHAALDPRVRAG